MPYTATLQLMAKVQPSVTFKAKVQPNLTVKVQGLGETISVRFSLGSTTILNRWFYPANLFVKGEAGVWYDPSDLTTLFQDNAGTTPVTAPAQTVGLMLDKSQGLVLGPELVTNGNFSGGATGWSGSGAGGWLISGGVATHTAGTYGTLQTTATNGTTSGKSYLLTFDFAGTGALNVYSRNALIASVSGTGSKRYIFTAAATSGVTLNFEDQTFNGTIDNISIKLLAGNHATQPTLAQRPTYGINPITGTRNLLTYTEQFDNAAWVKTQATVSANTAVAPDGTTTADSILDTAVSNIHYIAQNITSLAPSGKTYTMSAYAKANTLNFMTLGISDISSGTLYAVAVFNLSTGAVSTSRAAGTGYSVVSSSISSVGNGWYRCVVTVVAGTSVAFLRSVLAPNKTGVIPADAGGLESYLGNGSGFYAWGAQLELGSTATAYQKVVSQYEVTEVGVQSVSYLRFDGVDDGMVTNTITPNIDKVQVFAGVRKLSDATTVIAELSADRGSNAGSWTMFALTGYGWVSRGSLFPAGANSGAIAAPVTNVLTGISDINTDLMTLGVNGVQVATSSVDQGTGNFLAYPLYIGRRGGTTLPFNGRIYNLIVRFGANLTASQIASTENWVNTKTGAY